MIHLMQNVPGLAKALGLRDNPRGLVVYLFNVRYFT